MNIASELRPHDLFCIITESHADIFAARAVCEGHFQEAGETVTMSMPPRWLGPHLPPDQEWRIAWHKFYFGLDLSHAFAVTGERRFLDVWLQLVLSFIDQIPPGSESDCHVTSRRILNWIYAWVRFASTAEFPGLGAQVAERLVESIGRQAHHVRRNLSPKLNHRTIELTAIFHTALALPIVDPDQSLLQFSLAALDESLKQDILDDGVHRERSTHYHMITLRNFLGCRLNGQRYGAVFPPGFDERLERACEFALHCHRPDGGIPAFSDSDGGSYLDLIGLAADLFQRTDFRYSATRGKSGNPPRDGASFVHGGYFTQRSSWNQPEESFADARHLVWDCGSVGEGGHGHYDALHFELAAGGKPLLIDPGRFTYSEASPNWRRWFKGTSAHNTICVDGLDQTPYDSWNVGGVSSRQARAQFLGRWSVEGLDMLRGVVGSHCYCAKHQRTILFITGEYWLVEDSVTDTLSHTYDLRFHLSPSATGNTVVSKRGDCCVVQSPGLTLLSMGGDALRLEDGWFAPKYGVKEPAPVISIEKKDSNAKFVTLLFPTFSGNKVVRFVHNKEESYGGRSSVEIQWKNSCASFNDSVIWSDFVTELQIGPNRAKGVAAWSRQDLNGAAQKFVAASELTVGPEKS